MQSKFNILKSLVIVVAMVAVVAGATSAFFSDRKSIAGNTFSTGNIELSINHGELKPWNVSNFAPGYTTTWEYASVTNVGSIAGNLTITAPQTGGNTNLYNALNIEVRLNSSSGPQLYNGPVKDLNFSTPLNAGETKTSYQRVYLPNTDGDQNYLQSLSTTFDEVFYIQQP